jgi:hypothetical protein
MERLPMKKGLDAADGRKQNNRRRAEIALPAAAGFGYQFAPRRDD